MTSRPCAGCLRISTSSSGVSSPGLFSTRVGHADLADVVERRQGRRGARCVRASGSRWKSGCGASCLREHPRVLLRAPRVLAGLDVPDLGERQQRLHHQHAARWRSPAPPDPRGAARPSDRATVIAASARGHAEGREERRQERAGGRRAVQYGRAPQRRARTRRRRARPTRGRIARQRSAQAAKPITSSGLERRRRPRAVDRKSRCSRLSATVAWTSTPVKSVSSGVETTSRVPSAVVPTNTILSANVRGSSGRRARRPPRRR